MHKTIDLKITLDRRPHLLVVEIIPKQLGTRAVDFDKSKIVVFESKI
jgi:hypothetical protein